MTTETRSALRAVRRLGLWWVVGVIAGAGLLVVGLGQVRPGGYLLATACAVGGLLRAIRPLGRAGGLAVRRRSVAVVCWLGLGATVAVAFALVRL